MNGFNKNLYIFTTKVKYVKEKAHILQKITGTWIDTCLLEERRHWDISCIEQLVVVQFF